MPTRGPSWNVLAKPHPDEVDGEAASSSTLSHESGVRRIGSSPPPSQPSDTLAAALSFLEGIASGRLCRDDLSAWIMRHLVTPGYMPRSFRIQEPLFGALPSDKSCADLLPESPPTDETTAILVRARARILGKLRGLLENPPDDRFLSAAIFAGRVRRVLVGQTMTWIPRPRSHDPLSEVVTSLFVADVLCRREFYAQNLCICASCGRVRFNPDPALRRACLFC